MYIIKKQTNYTDTLRECEHAEYFANYSNKTNTLNFASSHFLPHEGLILLLLKTWFLKSEPKSNNYNIHAIFEASLIKLNIMNNNLNTTDG